MNDLSLYQISILKEVKDQILHQTLVNNYTPEETRAYLDTIGILDEKVEEINRAWSWEHKPWRKGEDNDKK